MSEFKPSFGDLPSDVALFDIEHRAHIGTATPDDALSLFTVIGDLTRRVTEANEAKSEAEEEAAAAARDVEALEDTVRELRHDLECYEEDRTPRRKPNDEAKSALEALEVWRKRALEAEGKLERKARKGAAK